MKATKVETDLEDFRKMLNIEIIDNSRLFTVRYRDKDPELAAKVVNEMAKQLSIAVVEIVNVENIRIIDKALVPEEPAYPKSNMIMVIAAFIGLIVSLLVIYFIELFDDTYATQEEVERELELPVVAIIPRYRKGIVG